MSPSAWIFKHSRLRLSFNLSDTAAKDDQLARGCRAANMEEEWIIRLSLINRQRNITCDTGGEWKGYFKRSSSGGSSKSFRVSGANLGVKDNRLFWTLHHDEEENISPLSGKVFTLQEDEISERRMFNVLVLKQLSKTISFISKD